MSKIHQYSTIGALMSGYFNADEDVYQHCSCTSIGLGCSELLNAELTIQDGQVYTATAEKMTVKEHPPFYVPFYQVTSFDRYQEYPISCVSNITLENILTSFISLKNNFVAIRIIGEFSKLVLRRPYCSDKIRKVKDISDQQQVSEYNNINGYLIGFWTPEIYGRISVPGFHLHFLSDDFTVSGHVLSYQLSTGQLQFEEKATIELKNPTTNDFQKIDIDLESLDQMIEHVEK